MIARDAAFFFALRITSSIFARSFVDADLALNVPVAFAGVAAKVVAPPVEVHFWSPPSRSRTSGWP